MPFSLCINLLSTSLIYVFIIRAGDRNIYIINIIYELEKENILITANSICQRKSKVLFIYAI